MEVPARTMACALATTQHPACRIGQKVCTKCTEVCRKRRNTYIYVCWMYPSLQRTKIKAIRGTPGDCDKGERVVLHKFNSAISCWANPARCKSMPVVATR